MKRRYLVLYDNKFEFEPPKRPDILYKITQDAKIQSSTISFFIKNDGKYGKWRRRSTSKNKSIKDIVYNIEYYDKIALDDPIERNFLNTKSHISFDNNGEMYYIEKFDYNFSLNDVYCHLHLLIDYFTPGYGFSDVSPDASLLGLVSGIITTSMDELTLKRTSDFSHSLNVTHEHLLGKIHDVYEMNVLSSLHLERDIGGISLGAWIEAGNRGTITKFKQNVFVWIVPAEIRVNTRKELFDMGALIASV